MGFRPVPPSAPCVGRSLRSKAGPSPPVCLTRRSAHQIGDANPQLERALRCGTTHLTSVGVEVGRHKSQGTWYIVRVTRLTSHALLLTRQTPEVDDFSWSRSPISQDTDEVSRWRVDTFFCPLMLTRCSKGSEPKSVWPQLGQSCASYALGFLYFRACHRSKTLDNWSVPFLFFWEGSWMAALSDVKFSCAASGFLILPLGSCPCNRVLVVAC